MMRNSFRPSVSMRVLLGVLTLLVYAAPGSAVLGVRRRTAAVAYTAGASTSAAAASSAAAAQQSAAAQETAAAQTAAAQSAAAASQASAAAAEAAAASKAAAPVAKTTQQKLQDLQSLYNQKLITEAEYNAARAKILAEIQ